MNTEEGSNARTDACEIVELGAASVETMGSLGIHTEVMGFDPAAGISQE